MLQLFPAGIEGTLLVPVLVGLLVMAATTEWWGWDFVGLVVPGYLCSVLLLQPAVAAVVLVEAVLTWVAVHAIDAAASRSGWAFPVFGRDRFYLVLVTSVGVRLFLESFALQAIAVRLQTTWPQLESYRTELFGLGVVLVPLTANRLWRPGLSRGLFQLAVQTGVVLLVVGGLLTRYTNFSIGGFELAYDQLAVAFISSPRTQIALLLTAAAASELNRRYGWDFHGILVPALLALAVVTPLKLVSTVLEAGLIVVLARLIVALPMFRNANIEGPRKLLLCFLVSFVSKLVFASLLSSRFPGYRTTDFFGMGYLLPSLLAERIWLKSNVALVLLPTLQTALFGAAQAIGLVLLLGYLAPSAVSEAGAASPVEHYGSLVQAAAALGPLAQRGVPATASELAALARRGPFVAQTADGYRVALGGKTAALVAVKSGAAHTVTSAFSEGEAAAEVAVARGANLTIAGSPEVAEAGAAALGAPSEAWQPLAPRGVEQSSTEPARALLLAQAAQGAAALSTPERALAQAAFRIDRDRGDWPRLARSLAPLGLSLIHTADSRVLLRGAGWPSMLLAAEATAVVVAPHAREVDTFPAALFAADRLAADCVVGALPESEALTLASALAQVSGRPLLIVRGAAEPAEGARLLLEPEEPGDPKWLMPLLASLRPRFEVSREAGPVPSTLGSAFPKHAGRAAPVAVLALSRRARASLGGAEGALERPGLVELAERRGVKVERGDLVSWLLVGTGEPSARAVELAERIVLTGDVALLRPSLAEARFILVFDPARGLSAVAVEERGRRALALSGERRNARAVVHLRTEANEALSLGARVLASGRTTR